MKRLRIIGAVLATLAVTLLTTAAPAQGTASTRSATTSALAAEGNRAARAPITQVSCRMSTTQYICSTPVLNTASTTIFHLATQGIPYVTPQGPGHSFVRVIDQVNGQEVLREYRYNGDEHDHWRGQVYSRYKAELHCPYRCAGAVLYFANG